jgi:hypothetical protein
MSKKNKYGHSFRIDHDLLRKIRLLAEKNKRTIKGEAEICLKIGMDNESLKQGV